MTGLQATEAPPERRFCAQRDVVMAPKITAPNPDVDRFGVAYQPALVIVDTDGSTELVAGAVDEELLGQIISEAD